jgi:hypothetical protein
MHGSILPQHLHWRWPTLSDKCPHNGVINKITAAPQMVANKMSWRGIPNCYPFFTMLNTKDPVLVWTAIVLAIGVVFPIMYAPQKLTGKKLSLWCVHNWEHNANC